MRNRTHAVVWLFVAVLVASAALPPALGTSTTATSGGVSVAVSPETVGTVPDGTTTVSIAVSNVTAGVGAYNLTVTLTDASVAHIKGHTLFGDPDGTRVETNDENSSLRITAYGVNTDETGTVDIMQLTLAGEAPGESAVGVDVHVLGDENGDRYAPVTVSAGQLSVTEETQTGTPTQTTTITATSTTATTTPSTTVTTTDSPNNGGGGGGGGSVPPPALQLSVEQDPDGVRLDVRNARPGERARASLAGVTAGKVAFERVNLGFEAENSHILFNLRVGRELSGEMAPPPGDAVLGQVEVTTKYASAALVSQAVYQFRVPASALPTDATLDDVTVYRYTNGSWTEGHVERESATFTATMDGFSRFAIVVKANSDSSPTSTVASSTATSEPPTTASVTTGTETSATTTTPREADGGVPGFGMTGTVVALVATALLVLRRCK